MFVLAHLCRPFAPRLARRSWREGRDGLDQTCTAKTVQIVFPVGFLLDRHLGGDPRERDVGLRAAQLLQRRLRNVVVTCHRGGGGQHPVGADEIAALPDALAREPDRLLIVARDEMGIGGDAAIDRRERVART